MESQFITPANQPLDFSGGPIKTLRKTYGENILDFISYLKGWNRRRIKERMVSKYTPPFRTTPTLVVGLVFDICSSFGLTPEVKFLALEIFDRFVIHHYIDLREYSCEVSKDPSTQKKYWHRISTRAQRQALLRLTSSIQLASKFALQSTCITLKHIQQYLHKCGHPYNMRGIFLSEVRVFKTIGSKVPIFSIFDFTNILLQGLQCWTDVDQLYLTCEKMLEFTFLQRDEIYARYFWMETGRWERTRHEIVQFAHIEMDNFLMASAVIVSSLYVHHMRDLGPNRASEILSELTDVSSNDIRGLAILISQMALGTRTVKFSTCS